MARTNQKPKKTKGTNSVFEALFAFVCVLRDPVAIAKHSRKPEKPEKTMSGLENDSKTLGKTRKTKKNIHPSNYGAALQGP